MTDVEPRPAATSRDDYTLTIDEVATRYEAAGHPRIKRTLQRYCANGHLDCVRQETPFGDQFLVTAASVARHIAQIAELAATVSPGEPRRTATDVAVLSGQETGSHRRPAGSGEPRPAAADDRYVTQLESENTFLKTQVSAKDTQIAALLERDHETNALINGLQRMLGPLLAPPKPDPSPQQPATDSRG